MTLAPTAILFAANNLPPGKVGGQAPPAETNTPGAVWNAPTRAPPL